MTRSVSQGKVKSLLASLEYMLKGANFSTVNRVSRREVPHLLVKVGPGGAEASVCYFKSTKEWRIFYPFMSDKQWVWVVKKSYDVLDLVQNVDWKCISSVK